MHNWGSCSSRYIGASFILFKLYFCCVLTTDADRHHCPMWQCETLLLLNHQHMSALRSSLWWASNEPSPQWIFPSVFGIMCLSGVDVGWHLQESCKSVLIENMRYVFFPQSGSSPVTQTSFSQWFSALNWCWHHWTSEFFYCVSFPAAVSTLLCCFLQSEAIYFHTFNHLSTNSKVK